jgi:hypothetical protein
VRPRLLLPAALASALIAAAAFALPAFPAYADDPTPTASATAPASAVASPTGTPSPSPGAIALTGPRQGLPWAVNHDISYNDQKQGVLSVYAWEYGSDDPGPITSVTATLVPVGAQAGGTAATVVQQLQADPGFPPDGYWTSPLSLPTLGMYDVTVEVADSLGNDVTLDTGQVDYQDQVSFSRFDAVGPTELTYAKQTLDASGVLVATDPRTGATSPLAGAIVSVDYRDCCALEPSPLTTVVTAADGSFAVPVEPFETGSSSPNGWLVAEYTPKDADAAAYGNATAYSSGFAAQREQVRVTFTSKTDVDVPAGGSATLTGTVQALDGGVWKPAVGDAYQVDLNNDFSKPVATGVADADGRFSVTVSKPGSYQVEAAATLFFSYAWTTTPVTVHIPQTIPFSPLTITEDEYGEASIHGALKTVNGPELLPKGSWVEAQFSTNGKTWHNVGRCPLSNNSITCYATYGGRANGHWRLYYPGNADWKPAYSKSFYISREYTSVTGGKPSTGHPYRNQREYFSGTLRQYYSSAWHAFPKTKVRLVFRPTGSKTWYLMATATTDSKGRYRISAKDPEGGTWEVVYIYADSKHIVSGGPTTWVGLR